MGDGISRDPIGVRGGLNMHCYVQNSPVSNIDPDGRIKVTTITTDPKSTCGSADHVKFRFELDAPAAEDGFIVQENTISIPYERGIVQGWLFNDHFWEAWFVKKGETYPAISPGSGQSRIDDTVFWSGLPNTKGKGGVKGTIKFFYAKKTGQLDDTTTGPWSGRGKAPASGGLPSTRASSAVTWWNDQPDNGEAIAERSVSVEWDCTCPAPTSSIKVAP